MFVVESSVKDAWKIRIKGGKIVKVVYKANG
jgi:hypothetical protein